jgi:iron complex outermembrane receptor protein
LARYSLTDGQSMYQFGNNFYNGYKPSAYYPRKWEETQMLNAAIDFGFSNNRITGTLEYYNRKTIDLLNSTNLPAGSNFSNEFVANVATMKNEGVELTLNASVIKKKDMNLDFSFNANYNKNTITKLRLNDDPSFAGNQYGGVGFGGNTVQINSVGYTRGTFYVFKQIYDPKSGKPIEGLVEDINRDGNVNKEKDLYRYKQVDPIMFMGFTTNFNYKNFSAGFVLRGSFGNYIFNARNARLANLTNVINNYGSGFLSNSSTDVLYTNFKDVKDQSRLSDYYVENAAFIRMDNINFGYNFGKVISNATNLRLGANVQNVFVITKYKGLDPEVFGGIDNTNYVRPRVFVLSLNLDF